MLRFDALPERTAALLDRLKNLREAEGFVLIGGTALALQVGHRESEDLDLVWIGEKLPRDRISKLLTTLGSRSTPINVTDEASKLYAENEGLDLEDVQQDWQIDGVKVTFFAPYAPAQLAVYEAASPFELGLLRVLDKESIFKLKSSLILDRKASRDLFDLWYFLDREGKTIDDLIEAMDDRKLHLTLDAILNKLAPMAFNLADPGFKSILSGAPRTADELLQVLADFAAERREKEAYQLAVEEAPQSGRSDAGEGEAS